MTQVGEMAIGTMICGIKKDSAIVLQVTGNGELLGQMT